MKSNNENKDNNEFIPIEDEKGGCFLFGCGGCSFWIIVILLSLIFIIYNLITDKSL